MTGSVMRRACVAGAAAGLMVLSGWAAGPASGVSGGEPAPAEGYGFAAHIMVGDTARACSGALIDPEWIVTSTSCVSDGAVTAGPPPATMTVTVGRTDLSATTGGQQHTVTQVVPHPNRDVLLAKLAAPITAATPVPLATTAPVAGETLRVAGFGRTASAWVPERLHTAALTVQEVGGDGTFGLAAPAETPATVCKGDSGGPTLRPDGTSFRLAGLHHSSGQAGCLGMPADQVSNATVETRLDDLGDWIRSHTRGDNFVRLGASAAVLDTRSAIGAPTGARAAGATTTFQVAGVGGVPATGVTAVLLDVTAITVASPTYLSLFPEGTARRPVSMVNADDHQIISNTAVVPVSAAGKVSIYNSGGGVHMVADVEGYYTKAPSTTGGGFVPVTPTRLVDTRSGLGGTAGVLNPGTSRVFTLTGGVVPAGSAGLMINLIATGATGQGWVGTFASGGTTRSVMDYVSGTTSHGVAVKVGTDGKATFTNSAGGTAIHLVITAEGYWTPSATTGGGLRTLAARRLLDTRSDGPQTPLAASGVAEIATGLPAGSTALVNLTVINNAATGYLRAWPTGGTETTTSLLNYPAANTSARSCFSAVRVGAGGKISIRNNSTGTVDLITDLQGWHAP